jgi:hypothetical protein
VNFQFTKLFNEIEAELKLEYVGGAIKWADENYLNAWSNAITRFESAVTRAIEYGNFDLVKSESELYKNTILGLIRQYKQAKAMGEQESFLESLRSGA